MSYLKKTLLDDEKVVYYAKPHWIIFSRSLVWLLICVAIIILGPLFPEPFRNFSFSLHAFFVWLSFIVAVYFGFYSLLIYISSEYGITNQRVLMKVGLISRSSLEVFFQRLESIQIEQTFVGRILNYGTVIICGTGGSKDPFYFIPNPLEFRRQVQMQMEKSLKS